MGFFLTSLGVEKGEMVARTQNSSYEQQPAETGGSWGWGDGSWQPAKTPKPSFLFTHETRVHLRKQHTQKNSLKKEMVLTEFSLKGNLTMMDASAPWANTCAPPDSRLLRQKGGGFFHGTGTQKHLKSKLPPVPSPRKELHMHWMPEITLPYSNYQREQHGVYWAINIPLAHYPPVKCQTDDPGRVLFYSSHSQGEKPNLPNPSPPKGQ